MQTHTKYQTKLEQAKTTVFKDLNPDNLLLKVFEKEDEILFIVSTYEPNFSVFLSLDPKELGTDSKESKKISHLLEFFRITLESFFLDPENFTFLLDWEKIEISEEKSSFTYHYKIVRENVFVSLQASQLLGDFPLWWLKIPEDSSLTNDDL